MRIVLVPLIAMVGLSGCAGLEDDATTAPPASDCREGSGPLFVKYTMWPGFTAPDVAPDHKSLDREGDLFSFDGTYASDANHQPRPGTGQVNAAPGSLKGLTADEVRSELQRLGVHRADRDYNVTLAYRARISTTNFDHVCAAVPGLRAAQTTATAPVCADDPTLELVANTRDGSHTLEDSGSQGCRRTNGGVTHFLQRFDEADAEARQLAGA